MPLVSIEILNIKMLYSLSSNHILLTNKNFSEIPKRPQLPASSICERLFLLVGYALHDHRKRSLHASPETHHILHENAHP